MATAVFEDPNASTDKEDEGEGFMENEIPGEWEVILAYFLVMLQCTTKLFNYYYLINYT